uniref:Mediator of RNA polymerase II transcription subunit 13 n=1 Tax=Macrostomum lignano TaxID=282301 RepID=A0A1I8F993_9PLAT
RPSSHHRWQSPPPDSAPSSSTRAASPEASSSSAAAAASVAESPESLQFSARYLGWRRVDNSDIVCSNRSSRAVNQCIRAVSAAPGSPTDAGVLDSYLQLDWKLLTYCPGQSLAKDSPRPQPLLSIRLWGASGQNFCLREPRTGGGPGFEPGICLSRVPLPAGQQRSRKSGQLPCATGCKLLMMMMSASNSAQLLQPHHRSLDRLIQILPALVGAVPSASRLFPTPQAEPQKCVPCQYLGSCLMDQHRLNANSSSIDIDQLNSAIDSISAVLMASPSTISIVINDCLPARVEFRVRFLRFMGVSRRSVQLAGLCFKMPPAVPECHLCRCEPTAFSLMPSFVSCSLHFVLAKSKV